MYELKHQEILCETFFVISCVFFDDQDKSSFLYELLHARNNLFFIYIHHFLNSTTLFITETGELIQHSFFLNKKLRINERPTR